MTRTVLILIMFATFALVLFGMWRGWQNRVKRQSFARPIRPAEFGPPLLDPQTGMYVGSAYANSWQNRVAALSPRAAVTATLHPEGLVAGELFIPSELVVSARLAPGLAGKVVGHGGLLVIRWRNGEAEIDSGLRFDDKSVYPAWIRALSDGFPRSETSNSPSLNPAIRHSTEEGK